MMSVQIYEAELNVPANVVSIQAVQQFFSAICTSVSVSKKEALVVELALEEAIELFRGMVEEREDKTIHIDISIGHAQIGVCLRMRTRPIDVTRMAEYSGGGDMAGLGNFLMKSLMDNVNWRYMEKNGIELVLTKHLPSPVVAAFEEELKSRGTEITGAVDYRPLETIEDAFALASCAYEIFGYKYKDAIYYPQEILDRNHQGKMRSWIAVDEAGTVLGHYAAQKQDLSEAIAVMGVAFVRPECRGDGLFAKLADSIHDEVHASGLRGVYSLSVTSHTATQKTSYKYGRRSVGLRVAADPAIFVEGAEPGERTSVVVNYRALGAREPRTVFIPERYRKLVLDAYNLVGIDNITPGDPALSDAWCAPDRFDSERDFTWNRASFTVSGGEAMRHKLRAYTSFMCEQEVTFLLLTLDLEDSNTPATVEEAVQQGFFYADILPDSLRVGNEFHDAIHLQMLSGIKVKANNILLYQESAKEIFEHIKNEAPHVFV